MARTLVARKPFYAAAGAVDLAVAKSRELPGGILTTAATFLPRAVSTYGELVHRGETLLSSIRRQPTTQVATAQVRSAQAKAKAATTSATKAAKATAKAVGTAKDQIG